MEYISKISFLGQKTSATNFVIFHRLDELRSDRLHSVLDHGLVDFESVGHAAIAQVHRVPNAWLLHVVPGGETKKQTVRHGSRVRGNNGSCNLLQSTNKSGDFITRSPWCGGCIGRGSCRRGKRSSRIGG